MHFILLFILSSIQSPPRPVTSPPRGFGQPELEKSSLNSPSRGSKPAESENMWGIGKQQEQQGRYTPQQSQPPRRYFA